jgi:hypothetical protein
MINNSNKITLSENTLPNSKEMRKLMEAVDVSENDFRRFGNGQKVNLVPPYSDHNDETYTLSQWDEERKRGWIEDKDGFGWYVTSDQIELAHGEDDYEDDYEYVEDDDRA